MTIRRTILEWEKIAYGEDRKDLTLIPRSTADRIAAVAATSPLAGRGGGGVLEHGRFALRARGVVGVIAADGSSLEILPKIDVQEGDSRKTSGAIRRRLVHMLALALDVSIDVGRIADLDWQQDTLLEILIRVFSEKLVEAVRKGMPRRYVDQEKDLPALRGSLDVARQFTVLAANPSRLACRFDALSEDIALNRIMKATVERLGRAAQSIGNQRRLRELAFVYADIADVPVSALRWDHVILDRTNERWRELLNLARLLLGDRFQTTSSGATRGFSLLFEMSKLFEEYIGRLASRALVGSGMHAIRQGGRLYCLTDEEANRGIFQTKPDILVKCGSDIVQIIDTKWKRIASRIDDQKQGVSQADVYQMMAYGQLYKCSRLTLLYPHHSGFCVGERIHSSHRISGHDGRLETATFDVAVSREPAKRLRSLFWEPQSPGIIGANVALV